MKNNSKLTEMINGLKSQEKLAKGLVEELSKLTPDTLRFIKNYLSKVSKPSITQLLTSDEDERDITFPDGRTVKISLNQLRDIPKIKDMVNSDELMSNLAGVSLEEYITTKSKQEKSQTDNLVEISMFMAALSTELMLFVPITSGEMSLFAREPSTVFDLNIEVMNVLFEPMLNSKAFTEDFRNSAVKVQTLIYDSFIDKSVVLDPIVNQVSPKSGLNQKIPLSENGSARDVVLVRKIPQAAKEFSEGLENILALTRLFIGIDYPESKLVQYDAIMSSLTHDRLELVISAKTVDTVLPLKIEAVVKYVSHTEAFHTLTQNLDEDMLRPSYGALQVSFFDYMSLDGEGMSQRVEVSRELAVEYFEVIQGYEKGYISKMEDYAKQMFLAYQAVASIEQNVCSCLTEQFAYSAKAVQLHNVHKSHGFNDQVYRFAVPVYYKEDRTLDNEAIKSKENLRMINPYAVQINS